MEEKEDVFNALKEMFCTHLQGCYPFDTDTFQHFLYQDLGEKEQ